MEDKDSEINNFIKVWITALASLTYCYYLSSKLPKGLLRLLSVIPVVALFVVLPLCLSSIHLSGPTGFFLAWLANFKLLLFAFDQGPLSSHLHLLHFIALASLPIQTKLQKNQKSSSSPLKFIVKVLLLCLVLLSYAYKQHLHPKLLLSLYSFHIYLQLEIILAVSAFLARSLTNLELEPHFDKPYLSTSLQDFWGKRWNLMVTNILRPTIYQPVRWALGKKYPYLALPAAVLATFAVSGIMHELMFFYLNREKPTWEVMGFFVLHGVCLVVEIVAKKALRGRPRWRLHPVVSVPLTVGFVMITSFWLFFPEMLRGGGVEVRVLREYTELVDYVRGTVRALGARIGAPSA